MCAWCLVFSFTVSNISSVSDTRQNMKSFKIEKEQTDLLSLTIYFELYLCAENISIALEKNLTGEILMT